LTERLSSSVSFGLPISKKIGDGSGTIK